MLPVEKAGWTGFTIGVLSASMIATFAARQHEHPIPEPLVTKHVVTNTITVEPDCYEDEVYVWFGDFPDDVEWHCVPLDSLIGGDP